MTTTDHQQAANELLAEHRAGKQERRTLPEAPSTRALMAALDHDYVLDQLIAIVASIPATPLAADVRGADHARDVEPPTTPGSTDQPTANPDSVTVYGASDDLVEVEGAVREEFHPADADKGSIMAFSTGALLRIWYDQDGIWRITPLAGSDNVTITQCASDGDGDDYSDLAVVPGARWVVHGDAWAEA